MDKVQVLKEWSITYFKHRDIIARKIQEIKDTPDGLLVKYKDFEAKVLLLSELSGFETKLDNTKTIVVTFNSKANLKTLIEAWSNINNKPLLSIIFINPLSDPETKWIIFPKTHSLVADDDTIAQGLRSLFGGVEEVTPEILKRLCA